MKTQTLPQDSVTRSKNILGPIFELFLAKLDAQISYLARQPETKVLFVSRAGVRIRQLYRAYLNARGRVEDQTLDYLWISRFMASKALWAKRYDVSAELWLSEFRYAPIASIIKSIYIGLELPASFNEEDLELKKSGEEFPTFIWSDHPVAHDLRWRLTQQGEFFEKYWQKTLNGAKRVVLIDSGWQGTIQRILADGYQEIDFLGLYFGRSGTQNSDRRYWDKMVGLVFENDTFNADDPATAINLHRHLIESVLEPHGKSIEFVTADASGNPYFPESEELLRDSPIAGIDDLFQGILEHLSDPGTVKKLAAVKSRAQQAAKELAQIILYPCLDDCKVFGGMSRSADFGRDIKVPTLIASSPRFDGDNAERRISESLWPSAQAAIEYCEEIRPHRQKIEVPGGISEAALRKKLSEKIVLSAQANDSKALVAVITRTMDRPIFLRRALRSVAAQSYKNYLHVIVCDGGDIDIVKRTIEDSAVDHTKIILIDNIVNRGMEAASNIGIRSSASDYIVIHDDDDSWEPSFLQKMTQFLESKAGRKYGGAISHCHYISEEVLKDSIVERGRQGYNDWVRNIQILEMAAGNFFAPIAFLFRRELYERLVGFDEALPVLGDWDFNLRFLAISDIGVLPEKLALYHHRDTGNKKLFGNSVIDGIDKHTEYNSVMRNKHIRMGGEVGARLAFATAVGIMHAENRVVQRNNHDHTVQVIQSHFSNPMRMSQMEAPLSPTVQAELDDRWNAIAMLMGRLNALDGQVEESA